MLEHGAALLRARGITSDLDLGPLVDPSVPFDGDPLLLQRLQHMYDAGAWVLMESALADLPADLRWLYESGAVTLEQLAGIHRAIGATSAADIGAAIEDGTLRTIPGIDDTAERAIAGALPGLRQAIPRIPLGRAITIVDPVVERLRTLTGIEWAEPAGSLRRAQDTVGDLEVVASATDPAAAIEELSHHAEAGRVLHRGERRIYLLFDRAQLGVRFPAPDRAGAVLWRLTGSVAHVTAISRLARQRGVDLNGAASEEELYARLGLPLIPAEIRDGADEIAAAKDGRLPHLVSRAHIRGDLHMHTSFSDGRDSVEAMVTECHRLGYEYIAITDHSQSAMTSRTLTPDVIGRQADEIAAMRGRFPSMAIFHGCEVDILPDGRLDFPDRVLEKFDIVLASLHDAAGHDAERLESRYLSAMKHPLVTLITHPTNRLVPHRAGYKLNYERLFAAAVETGTFMEIDGAPAHLDMDGVLARRAIAAGVDVSI
ncbi:MAG TPA: PHP domain-containing protein, partial [Vicinamibacterales bacterium]|nr:PHP domain-containing protein [Vicinamibacterales bacterium]